MTNADPTMKQEFPDEFNYFGYTYIMPTFTFTYFLIIMSHIHKSVRPPITVTYN